MNEFQLKIKNKDKSLLEEYLFHTTLSHFSLLDLIKEISFLNKLIEDYQETENENLINYINAQDFFLSKFIKVYFNCLKNNLNIDLDKEKENYIIQTCFDIPEKLHYELDNKNKKLIIHNYNLLSYLIENNTNTTNLFYLESEIMNYLRQLSYIMDNPSKEKLLRFNLIPKEHLKQLIFEVLLIFDNDDRKYYKYYEINRYLRSTEKLIIKEIKLDLENLI